MSSDCANRQVGARSASARLMAALALTLSSALADAGLVSHWPAEQSAADAADGNDGVTNGVMFAPGMIGQAFAFDGDAGDAILVADAANLRFPAGVGFTLTAWVKTTASGFYYHDILRRRNRDVGGGWLDVKVSMTSSGATYANKAQFSLLNVLNANSAAIVYGTTSLNDGRWHCPAFKRIFRG